MSEKSDFVLLKGPGDDVNNYVRPAEVGAIRPCPDRKNKCDVAVAGQWIRVQGSIYDVAKQLGFNFADSPKATREQERPAAPSKATAAAPAGSKLKDDPLAGDI